MSPARAALLLAAGAASAQAPADGVARTMAKVDALVAREPGHDARFIDALDRQAAALFAAVKPLGWRAAVPLGAAARKPGRAPKSRLFAVTFLSKLRDPAAFAPLSDVLLDRDQDADVRVSAAQGLAELDAPPRAARRTFCAALSQADVPRAVSDEVLIALSRLGCEDAAPLAAVARAYGSRPAGADLASARRALTALGRSPGATSARALLALVAWSPPGGEIRAAAITALNRRREDLSTTLRPEALPVVRQALREETASPAPMLELIALADSFGPAGDELLLPLASHPDPEVLAAAAEALSRRKALAALPPLEAVLAGALNDPRYAPKPGRPDPALLLARLETAVQALRRARRLEVSPATAR
jgi:HEAT repeat protein